MPSKVSPLLGVTMKHLPEINDVSPAERIFLSTHVSLSYVYLCFIVLHGLNIRTLKEKRYCDVKVVNN